jgi:hypothetical protein
MSLDDLNDVELAIYQSKVMLYYDSYKTNWKEVLKQYM